MDQQPELTLSPIEAVLRAANIPPDICHLKQSGLSSAERQLYQAVLRAFPQLGGPPSRARLETAATALKLELEATLRELAQRDLIVRDSFTGSITVAYPFSAFPTAHRVELADAHSVYAMCAVDALGIPFMLKRDATIYSTDPLSTESVHVQMRAGEACWDPPEAVILVCKREGCQGPECCAVINFFQSAQSAHAYQQAHPDLEGHILTPHEALEAGRLVFGNILT